MKQQMIWFDFGGVLSPPIDELFEIYHSRTGIPSNALKEAMKQVAADMGCDMLSPIENALLTEFEWGTLLRKKLLDLYPNLDTSKARLEHFGEQWFANITPNLAMIEEFKGLKKLGYTVGILTNNVVEWETHWKAMLGLGDLPDFIVDSCKERRRKPEPEFFYLAEKQSGVAAHECILIDDLKNNCDAAAERGWKTVLFTDSETAISELRTLLDSRIANEYQVAEPA